MYSNPAINKSGSHHAYYITFIEKAYSEAYSGLWNLNDGKIENALFDLTAAPSKSVKFWEVEQGTGEKRIVKKVKKIEKKEKEEEEEGFLDKLMFWKKKEPKKEERSRTGEKQEIWKNGKHKGILTFFRKWILAVFE